MLTNDQVQGKRKTPLSWMLLAIGSTQIEVENTAKCSLCKLKVRRNTQTHNKILT